MTAATANLVEEAREALLAPERIDALAPVRQDFDGDREEEFGDYLFDRLAMATAAAPRAALLARPYLERIATAALESDVVQDPTARSLVLDDAWEALVQALDATEAVTGQLDREAAERDRRINEACGIGVHAREEVDVDLDPTWAGEGFLLSPATNVDDAVALQRQGFALLPVEPVGKRPHARVLDRVYGSTSWKPLTERPATETELLAWYQADPELNIGVLTGKPSGGLVVLDLDGPTPESLRHPATPSVETGRGRHVYLRGSGKERSSKFDGGDLKASGGYVIAPPSLHASGTRYAWSLSPEDVALADFAAVQGLVLPLAPATSPKTEKVSDVGALMRDPEAVARMLPLLGIETAALGGKTFRCVLPGHEERSPSASLHPEKLVYADWHRRDGRDWYTLQEVYAARVNGKIIDLRQSRQEMALWAARLAVDAGVLRVERSLMATTTCSSGHEALKPSELALAESFALLFALNLQAHPENPAVLFTVDFAARWAGISRRSATRALGRLRELDVLRLAPGGGVVTRSGRMANRYLPGDGTRRPREGEWTEYPTWEAA